MVCGDYARASDYYQCSDPSLDHGAGYQGNLEQQSHAIGYPGGTDLPVVLGLAVSSVVLGSNYSRRNCQLRHRMVKCELDDLHAIATTFLLRQSISASATTVENRVSKSKRYTEGNSGRIDYYLRHVL